MARARPLPPDERRQALVEATLPLLIEHGRAVTTRQIARAAGVAEGTIFRAFPTKEDLIDAAVVYGFHRVDLRERIEQIDPALPLRDRLVVLVTLLQNRFQEVFALMAATGHMRPPDQDHEQGQRDLALFRSIVGVIGPDAGRLRVSAEQFAHYLRLLTFSASHRQISDGHTLAPETIVDLLLFGSYVAEGDH